ncbi:proton-coupled folate transporter-like [Tubulanus polymorphus]|uniref:proton-coupled folate transporter-like n=1 Tax=Tubulanus polymorphus TaxID=672921 RepID=UPI003DA2D57A
MSYSATDNETCFANKSDPTYQKIAHVQQETSRWLQYVTLCSTVPVIFIVPFLGAYSDTVGRRIALVIPSMFSLIKAVISAFIIFYDLPVYTLLIPSFIEGCGGGVLAIMMISFAYISDTTSPMERALRITIAEGLTLFSAAVAQAGFGFWIEAYGFLWPYIFLVCLMFVNFVYVLFFVPETLVCDYKRRFSFVHQIKEITDVFKENAFGRRTKLILLIILIFVDLMPWSASKGITLLFCVNQPLCWGPKMVGVYLAGTVLIKSLMGIGGVKTLELLKVPEIWIALIGVTSNMASMYVNAFAYRDIDMYLVSVVGGLSMLAVSMFRTKISHLVHAHELGAIYAIGASVEATCTLIGMAGSQFIYQKTVTFAPGLAYFVIASTMLIAFVIVIVYAVYEKHTEKRLHEAIEASIQESVDSERSLVSMQESVDSDRSWYPGISP